MDASRKTSAAKNLDGQRAERTLRNLQKVLRHDLPTQLVAIQGLLQLLSLDEEHNLSDQGQEYLRRLRSAGQRAIEMAETIKKICQPAPPVRTEPIVLRDLCQEVIVEGKRLRTQADVRVRFALRTNTVIADRQILHRSLSHLFRAVVPPTTSGVAAVEFGSQNGGECVEIWIGRYDNAAKEQPGARIDTFNLDELKGLENRLELLYVQELIDGVGGTLKGASGRRWYSLAIPV